VAEDPYVYPTTNVLRNRFGLRDAGELDRRERDASALRLVELHARPLAGGYDLAHLQAFHRHIFGDVWPWAGEIRTVAIAKNDSMFALPAYIEPYLSGVLAELPHEGFLHGQTQDRIAERLTHYLAEINAAHPFREGNGRTQRAFISQLAADAGYHIAWERLTQQRNLETSIAAMRGDNAPLRQALDELLSSDQRPRRPNPTAASFPQAAKAATQVSHTTPHRAAGHNRGESRGPER